MFKLLFGSLLAVLVPALSYAQSSQTPPIDLDAGDIFKMASPSVVLIENIGEDGNRTGGAVGFSSLPTVEFSQLFT
jgi:hypothetical protein